MIELIRTFTGYTRAEGRVKITEAGVYRCTLCETIKPTKQEILKHECEAKTTTRTKD
jgi:hypothetical protein